MIYVFTQRDYESKDVLFVMERERPLSERELKKTDSIYDEFLKEHTPDFRSSLLAYYESMGMKQVAAVEIIDGRAQRNPL